MTQKKEYLNGQLVFYTQLNSFAFLIQGEI